MTTTKKNRNLIFLCAFILLLCFISIGYIIKHSISQQIQSNLIIEALQNGLKKTVDKQGRETAEKQILITTVNQLKAAHVSDSSAIGHLQKLVDKRTTSAAIVKNHTSGSLTSTNTSVTFGTKTDSLTKITQIDSCDPVYKDTLRDGWTEIALIACKDSTHADYTVRNEYEQTQGLGDLQGKFPFRYRAPVMKIKNLNPHTKTDEINAWAVQVPNIKKKVTIAAGFGAAAGLILGIVLTR